MRWLKYLGLALRVLPVVQLFMEGIKDIFNEEDNKNDVEKESKKKAKEE